MDIIFIWGHQKGGRGKPIIKKRVEEIRKEKNGGGEGCYGRGKGLYV